MSRSCPGCISPVITSAGVCYSMVPSHVVSFAACWLFCTPSPTLSSPAPTRFFSLVSLLVPSSACIPAQLHHIQPISLHHLCRGRCADMSICLSRTSALVAVPVPWSARLFGSHWSRWCVLHPPLPAVRRDCEAIACDGRGQFSLSIYTLSLRLRSTLSWRLLCTRVWCMHVKPTTPQTSGNDQYWEQKPPCLVAPARTPTLYPSIRCRLLHNDINPLCQRRASVLQCAALFWCLDICMSLALVYCPPPPPLQASEAQAVSRPPLPCRPTAIPSKVSGWQTRQRLAGRHLPAQKVRHLCHRLVRKPPTLTMDAGRPLNLLIGFAGTHSSKHPCRAPV